MNSSVEIGLAINTATREMQVVLSEIQVKLNTFKHSETKSSTIDLLRETELSLAYARGELYNCLENLVDLQDTVEVLGEKKEDNER